MPRGGSSQQVPLPDQRAKSAAKTLAIGRFASWRAGRELKLVVDLRYSLPAT